MSEKTESISSAAAVVLEVFSIQLGDLERMPVHPLRTLRTLEQGISLQMMEARGAFRGCEGQLAAVKGRVQALCAQNDSAAAKEGGESRAQAQAKAKLAEVRRNQPRVSSAAAYGQMERQLAEAGERGLREVVIFWGPPATGKTLNVAALRERLGITEVETLEDVSVPAFRRLLTEWRSLTDWRLRNKNRLTNRNKQQRLLVTFTSDSNPFADLAGEYGIVLTSISVPAARAMLGDAWITPEKADEMRAAAKAKAERSGE